MDCLRWSSVSVDLDDDLEDIDAQLMWFAEIHDVM